MKTPLSALGTYVLGFAICGIVASRGVCQSTGSVDVASAEVSQRITRQLLESATNMSVEGLRGAMAQIAEARSSLSRKEQAVLWFRALAITDSNLDHNFGSANYNLTNSFQINLIPPVDGPGGVQYPSGVDPSVLTNPTARSNYEAALKLNREHGLRYAFQDRLHDFSTLLRTNVMTFIRSSYTLSSNDKEEVLTLLKGSELSDQDKEMLGTAIH